LCADSLAVLTFSISYVISEMGSAVWFRLIHCAPIISPGSGLAVAFLFMAGGARRRDPVGGLGDFLDWFHTLLGTINRGYWMYF